MRSDQGAVSTASRPALKGDEVILANYANQLLKKHGRNADVVAIKRADALFHDGDEAGGQWWLRLFRHLALSKGRRNHA